MLEAENSDGGGGAVAAAENLKNEEGGGGGSASGGFGEEGYQNLAGNRWPREETLALLKIRSDMDVAFRDSTLKAPLWDEVSRKLAELGYNRSAKKCKEKFENIYKYHKRTRDCRSNRPNTKNYRFFEQLERLDNHPPSPSKNQIKPSNMTETTMVNMTTIKPSIFLQDFPNSSAEFFMSNSASASASTTSSSELENGKKKRRLGDYFERLVKQVLEKQEDLQNKFMEALDKCEKDRIEREEAWKAQESARMEREKQVLAQERAITAAKDAAVIAFLQKISNHPLPIPENPTPIPNPSEEVVDRVVAGKCGISNLSQTGSSRWPKAEVEALISVRANLELQYQDNGSPKGPLWEEISSSMKKLGYNRSAKRCKEKWENINKYFRRVKESNKKRPQDSKTCPYFDMLESLYEKKAKMGSSGFGLEPEDILMQMMGQTQEHQEQRHETAKGESENVDQNGEDFGDDVDGDDEDENENVDNYQIVVNSTTSMTKME